MFSYEEHTSFEDLFRTLKTYEFTRRAERQMDELIDSDAFDKMDSDEIYYFLLEWKEQRPAAFHDYLKRYLFCHPDFEDKGRSFGEIENGEYKDFLDAEFQKHAAPHSLKPVTTPWRGTLAKWVTEPNATRDSVFLLGFGLQMTDREVSTFLTSVLGDTDFDFADPNEAAFWYCFRHDEPYAAACELLKQSCSEPADSSDFDLISSAEEADKAGLERRETLLAYLKWLNASQMPRKRAEISRTVFSQLIARSKKLLAGINLTDVDGDKSKTDPNAITSRDLERTLCCGHPYDKSSRMLKVSTSALAGMFGRYRLNAPRIDKILHGSMTASRYDLLTLVFFLHSQAKTEPADRIREFLHEANETLSACQMYRVHPANPYEAFLMLCLASVSEPLGTYSDVIEDSYPRPSDPESPA